jgi:hypothetical protein
MIVSDEAKNAREPALAHAPYVQVGDPGGVCFSQLVAVIHMTTLVLRSAAALPLSKRCSCIHGVNSCVCIAPTAIALLGAFRVSLDGRFE